MRQQNSPLLTVADLGALDQEQHEVQWRPPFPLQKDCAFSLSRELKAGRVTFAGTVLLCENLSPDDQRHRLLGNSMRTKHEEATHLYLNLEAQQRWAKGQVSTQRGCPQKRLCVVPKSRRKGDALEISIPGSGTMTLSQPPVSAACKPENGPL